MSQRKKIIIPTAIVFTLALGGFALGHFGVIDAPWTPEDRQSANGSNQDEEDETPPVPVELAEVGPRRISAYYRSSSVIEADRQVDLVAKTTGRVRNVNVEEGDWVQRGQLLAELENEREKIQLRQAQLKEADQKREFTRRQSLLEQSLVTQEEFDATKSAYDLAVTERELAQVRVADTEIRAPFDGQVTLRRIVEGQHLNPSETLFSLVDFEPLRVRVHLPEVIARKVSAGDEVHLDVESQSQPIGAVVERISPVVDPNTSTVRLTLLVGGDAQLLSVGGFVKVRITTDTQTEALSIPKLALVEEGGLRSVFIAEADSVRKVEVRTGLYDETHIEVLDGLDAGGFVVTLGQGGLREGSRIDVLNADQVGWIAPEKPAEEHADSEEDDDKDKVAAEDGQAALAMGDEAGQAG